MRYCAYERQDFPETEFEVKDGIWFHIPPDDPQNRHRATRSAAPPPQPDLELPEAEPPDAR